MSDTATPQPLTPEAAAAGHDPAAVSQPSFDDISAGMVDAEPGPLADPAPDGGGRP